MQKLFGTDGIRGIFGSDPFDSAGLKNLAETCAKFFDSAQRTKKRKVFLAWDTRTSAEKIVGALCDAFSKQNLPLECLGVFPTPALSYVIHSAHASGGIMVTASHNPAAFNGLKILGPSGHSIDQAQEQQFEKIFFQKKEKFKNTNNLSKECSGHLSDLHRDLYSSYVKKIIHRLNQKKTKQKLHFIIDCAQGAFYKLAPEILSSLNLNLSFICTNPNGKNINDNCGATSTDYLVKTVVKKNADGGFAFDGDGDRVIACEAQGKILNGDQIIACLAKKNLILNDQQPKTVVTSVMSDYALRRFLKEQGIGHCETPVGNKAVQEKMQEADSVLGAEPSGHIITYPENPWGDGLITALLFLEACVDQNTLPKEFFPPSYQWHKTIHKSVVTGKALERLFLEKEKRASDKIRILIRPSGTEPVWRIMVEAPDQSSAEKIGGFLLKSFQEHVGS